MIEYREGDLFDAPKSVILVHACNAQGVWGSGVAKEFKRRFPEAFKQYNKFCVETNEPVGQTIVAIENPYKIGCLITSNNFGRFVDTPEQILNATRTSFDSLLSQTVEEIHMPMINSGLFKVQWNLTEEILIKALETNKRKCVVWIKK